MKNTKTVRVREMTHIEQVSEDVFALKRAVTLLAGLLIHELGSNNVDHIVNLINGKE